MNIKRRRSRVYRRFLRRNMTSLTTKGYFSLVIDQNDEIRLGVNFNGVNLGTNAPDSPTSGVLMTIDDTGSSLDMTRANVSPAQLNVIAANNAMYERRRIAWIKLWFYPRYSEYPAMVVWDNIEDEQTLTAVENKVLYSVTDMSGLEQAWFNLNKTSILANNTGVKSRLMNRPFKVFRRSIKYPPFPKYEAAALGAGLDTPTNTPAGQWLDTARTSAIQNGHMAFYAFMGANSVFPPGTDLYEVKFEIKYVWADRMST